MTTLASLIKELEAATEGSKDLDATIYCVLKGAWYPYALTVAEPVTTSIDAAVGLKNKLLPGWLLKLDEMGKDDWLAAATPPDGDDELSGGKTAPLAICLAVLSEYQIYFALEAEEAQQ